MQGVFFVCRKEIEMVVKKIAKTTNKRWPVKVVLEKADKKTLTVKVPDKQQSKSTFVRNHGCSLEAISIALQLHGIKKSPAQIREWCYTHLAGYNGSKITVFGATKVINGIVGKKVAIWHANTGKNNKKVRQNINRALKQGKVVLFEQKDPIHTVVFLGYKNKKLQIATYGGVRNGTVSEQVSKKALHGKAGAAQQHNYFCGSSGAAGYVTVKGGN